MSTLPEVYSTHVSTTHTCSQLFKDALLLGLPIFLTPFLEYTVEVVLCFLSTLFYSRNEVLFVGMTQITRDIGVLKGL